MPWFFCQVNSLDIGRSILYIFAHWIILSLSAEQHCSIHMYCSAASWHFVYLSAWPLFPSPSVISYRPSTISHHTYLVKIKYSLYMNIFIKAAHYWRKAIRNIIFRSFKFNEQIYHALCLCAIKVDVFRQNKECLWEQGWNNVHFIDWFPVNQKNKEFSIV